MTGANHYLSTLSPDTNGLNTSIKRQKPADLILKKEIGSTYLLPTINTPHHQRHSETKSERMEKDIPHEWKGKNEVV